MTYVAPPPRPAVADPLLTRPDWTAGVPRDGRLLWLDKNENGDPELVALAQLVLADLPAEALSTYPESTALYRKLAAHVGVGAEQLVLTAGSDGAIRSLYEAFISPGDVVVHTIPTFAMYAVYSRMYGARVVPLEYAPSDRGPSLPVDLVTRTIAEARPKLVCLPNPDSPTGTVFPEPELRGIIDAAGRVGALMLVDEAYHPFYEPTVVGWLADYPHLVVARTFAKAWGVAGLRIGYGVANAAVTRLLHKVRPMYEVNTVAVAMMERLLDHADAMRASVLRLTAGRNAFLDAMEGLGFRVLRARGNFLHVAFGTHAAAVHAALADLVLYRRDSNDPCLKGFSRFSATTEERFQPVIERIRSVVARNS